MDSNCTPARIRDSRVTPHQAVRAGAAHHRLTIVVAHRIVISQELQIWGIALKDVVETHCGGALAGGLIVEVRFLRLAVWTGSNRHLHPGERSALHPLGFQIVDMLCNLPAATSDRSGEPDLPHKRHTGTCSTSIGKGRRQFETLLNALVGRSTG